MGLKHRLLRAALTSGLALGVSASPAAAAGTPGSWTATGSLTTARAASASVTLADGRVALFGGTSTAFSSPTTLGSIEIYTPSTGQWTSGGSLVDGRQDPGAARLTSGKVLLASGNGAAAATTSGELYDPSTGSSSLVLGSLATARSLTSQVVALPNGGAIVLGGQQATAAVDLYTPGTGFSAAAPMGTARAEASAIGLPGGKVLVVGGDAAANSQTLATGEVYDPATNQWSAIGNTMSERRALPQLSLLTDGRVLITGGADQTGSLAVDTSTDIYNPSTNQFSPAAPLPTGEVYGNQTTLATGQVLVAGGATAAGSVLNNAELYDPAKNTWSVTAPLTHPRMLFAQALLPSGQVLAAGGFDSVTGAPAMASAEVYNPPTAPAAPSGVSATALDGQAFVSWSQPDDGGSPITAYAVTASTGPTTTTPDGRTATVVSGLANGRAVTFTVRAINGYGTGTASSPSNQVTPSAGETTTTTQTVAAPLPPAPKLTITGLQAKPTLAAFEQGVKLTIGTTVPVSLDVTLRVYTKKASVARASNLVLAETTAGRSGAKRTLTLKPSRTLLKGAAKSFTVGVVIVAQDALGRNVTITKTISVTTPKPKHKAKKKK